MSFLALCIRLNSFALPGFLYPILITSAKAVTSMYYPAFVCLSVCLLATSREITTDQSFMKILSEIWLCRRNSPSNVGNQSDSVRTRSVWMEVCAFQRLPYCQHVLLVIWSYPLIYERNTQIVLHHQWRRQLWGTGSRALLPLDFQHLFSSLWSKSDSQLSKWAYCVVCQISWCRGQQLTALLISHVVLYSAIYLGLHGSVLH